MGRPKNIGIDLAAGSSKNVTFTFSDTPDLRDTTITLTVKKHIVDTATVLSKTVDIDRSANLETGTFVIRFEPSDTVDLVPRTYKYELKIVTSTDTYIPVIGELKIYGSLT